MDYNLQIQKLLVKMDAVASPQDKLTLLKQAITLADTHNDVEWGFDLRLELIDVESDTPCRSDSLPAFTWIVEAYEQNPDLFKERDFVWKYKWMISYVRRNASISMEQIDAIVEDFKMRLQRNGYSLRAYYYSKVHMAYFLGNLEDARINLELADKELRDNMSNCAACELDDKVELQLRSGNFDSAMTMGQDLFTKKLTCGHMPFTTYCTCVECFTKANDFEKAHEFFLKAEEDLLATENDTSQILNVSKLILFLSIYNREKAWEYFEEYCDWSYGADDYYTFIFAKNILPLLNEDGNRTLKINAVMPWYKSDNNYDIKELYNYYYNIANDLARRFDARNNSVYVTHQLENIFAIGKN